MLHDAYSDSAGFDHTCPESHHSEQPLLILLDGPISGCLEAGNPCKRLEIRALLYVDFILLRYAQAMRCARACETVISPKALMLGCRRSSPQCTLRPRLASQYHEDTRHGWLLLAAAPAACPPDIAVILPLPRCPSAAKVFTFSAVRAHDML